MDSFLIEDLKRNKKEKPDDRKSRIYRQRRDRIIQMFEQANGYIGPKEISEALDINVDMVKRYLGEERLRRHQDILDGKIPQRQIGQKLSLKRADNLADERKRRILDLLEQGYTPAKIIENEKLTPVQAREIFFSLGINPYTEEEIATMTKYDEEAKARREEWERRRAERARRRQARKNREQEEIEKRKKAKEEQAIRQLEDETGIVYIKTCDDLIRAMRGLISKGQSSQAINLGESFLTDDMLSDVEKEKLRISLKELREIKEAYKRNQSREEIIERRREKHESSTHGENSDCEIEEK